MKALLRKTTVKRKRNEAELEIIEKLERMKLSGDDLDNIVDVVKTALDRQFT